MLIKLDAEIHITVKQMFGLKKEEDMNIMAMHYQKVARTVEVVYHSHHDHISCMWQRPKHCKL